ncbi:Methylated-DNA--protein-cysteine methyltransferase [Acipenser ruthenus]|uniref:Methylated-DNA--protein-cysteine methyltransferase n=1 Tax=Acipenser ruthenus TaxID=7906 RepID=A0A662YPP0_ACIRT|nr:Methylated-DNA--protein-cysteine methyltransferase [Acipenser ruthenus]
MSSRLLKPICEECLSKSNKELVLLSETGVASFACVVCKGQEDMTAPLKECTDWLHAYFCDPGTTEKLPFPAFHHPIFHEATFTRQVLQTLLRDVKFGETVSYKHLAEMAGNSKAVRAVGGAMRKNPIDCEVYGPQRAPVEFN